MRGLDTNILVRFLTADEPNQSEISRRLIETTQDEGENLHVSRATAATHIRNILAKTGLHDRKSLILLAYRRPENSDS